MSTAVIAQLAQERTRLQGVIGEARMTVAQLPASFAPLAAAQARSRLTSATQQLAGVNAQLSQLGEATTTAPPSPAIPMPWQLGDSPMSLGGGGAAAPSVATVDAAVSTIASGSPPPPNAIPSFLQTKIFGSPVTVAQAGVGAIALVVLSKVFG